MGLSAYRRAPHTAVAITRDRATFAGDVDRGICRARLAFAEGERAPAQRTRLGPIAAMKFSGTKAPAMIAKTAAAAPARA